MKNLLKILLIISGLLGLTSSAISLADTQVNLNVQKKQYFDQSQNLMFINPEVNNYYIQNSQPKKLKNNKVEKSSGIPGASVEITDNKIQRQCKEINGNLVCN